MISFRVKIFHLTSAIIGVGYIFAALNLSNNNIIEIFGRISLVASTLFSLVISFYILGCRKKIGSRIASVSFGLLMLVLIYTTNSVVTGFNIFSINRIIILSCILSVVYFFYYCGVHGGFKFFSNILSVVSIFNLILIFSAVMFDSGTHQSLFFNNANALGMFSIILFYYSLLFSQDSPFMQKCVIHIAAFSFAAVIIAASGSRTSMLALSTSFLVYLFWPIIARIRLLYLFVVFAIAASSFWVVYFLSSSKNSFAAMVIEGNLSSFSDKNLFSGRDRMWPTVIELISENLYFGLGAGKNTSDIFNVHYSAHNLYLQTLFQTGLLGFILLLFVIFCVFYLIYKARCTISSRVLISFFVALLIIQNFEITLFQNNMAFGFPFWVMFGLVMGESAKKRYQLVTKPPPKDYTGSSKPDSLTSQPSNNCTASLVKIAG